LKEIEFSEMVLRRFLFRVKNYIDNDIRMKCINDEYSIKEEDSDIAYQRIFKVILFREYFQHISNINELKKLLTNDEIEEL
jgi:hypothetical protein